MNKKKIIPLDNISDNEKEKILNFLNSARTINDIDDAIDIPNEHDIGKKIAQNILEAKSRCGKFTSIDEVYNISQIGPERFGDIVSAVSKLPESSKQIDPMLCEIPPNLRISVTNLRQHEKIILQKLKTDENFNKLFLEDPTAALASIQIPIDKKLKIHSKIQRNKDNIFIPQIVCLSNGVKLRPKIHINFVSKLEED